MYHWLTQFRTEAPWDTLPWPMAVGCETQDTSRYWLRGAHRTERDYCVFQWTLAGQGVFRDTRGRHAIGEGTGFLFNTHDRDWEYGYPPEAREPWRFLYIEFTGGNALRVVRELVRRHGAVFRPEPGVIPGLLEPWQGEGLSTRAVTAAEGARLVYGLLTALAQVATREEAEGWPCSLVQRARQHIGRRLDTITTASEVAAALGVSREHLSRCFHKETGISLYQHILGEKLEFARHLLRSSSLTGKEIAARLGFGSEAQFSRTFRQKTGLTPMAYRRRQG